VSWIVDVEYYAQVAEVARRKIVAHGWRVLFESRDDPDLAGLIFQDPVTKRMAELRLSDDIKELRIDSGYLFVSFEGDLPAEEPTIDSMVEVFRQYIQGEPRRSRTRILRRPIMIADLPDGSPWRGSRYRWPNRPGAWNDFQQSLGPGMFASIL
jgi:hypothetical protein